MRVAAIDTAPAQLASWIAAMPTLDEAARMITPSPMPPAATSMMREGGHVLHPDRRRLGRRSARAGRGAGCAPGTIACSAQMPYWPCWIIGSTQTRSPTAKPLDARAERLDRADAFVADQASAAGASAG